MHPSLASHSPEAPFPPGEPLDLPLLDGLNLLPFKLSQESVVAGRVLWPEAAGHAHLLH